jgi:two-component system alkaline phosphatase synthesis response regulator PhoP
LGIRRGAEMTKILIVEDEESILMPLEDNLRLEGYEVSCARDGLEGLSMAADRSFDLIVLDIMLPKLDGFEVCKRLRQDRMMTPILMLTAKSQEVDIVLGLELGADDYVTKPFSSRELLARVKAILRRASEPVRGIDFYRFGAIELDFVKYEAKKEGRPVPLTALEFTLLHFLVQNKGRVVHRNEVLDSVWGKDVYVDARTVDKHISLLRKKFEDDPQEPKYILGVRGVGYKFAG